MNAWAKRGLQAAFFTGGMLVLGAGIASANECCPDRPTPPLAPASASVSVPVHICDNVIGGPGGSYDTPCVHETLSTDQLVAAVPFDVPLAGAAGVTGGGALVDDNVRGNRGHLNLVVPVHVAGNAVAVGEDAVAGGSSEFEYHRHDPVYTDGDAGGFAGNVLAGDAVVPLVATGNAFGLLGNAYSDADSTTDVSSGGDVYTSGDGGPVAGNVVAPAFALPLQASGNGAGFAGTGTATGRHALTTRSGGEIGTTGQNNLLSGNVASGALAVPFQANANGVSGAGEGRSAAGNITTTEAAGNVISNGDPAVGSGNVVNPAAAGPVQLAGNAVAALAQAQTAGSGTNDASAGGDAGTTGSDSIAAGNVVNPALALPVQGMSNAVAGAGEASSTHGDTTASTASGKHSTDGRSGVVSGGVATVPVAGPVQLMGNAVAGAAESETDTSTDTATRAAGDSATNGNDSIVGGPVIGAPVALPVIGYGNGGAAIGTATARHTNEVAPTAGGDNYTLGDGSVVGGTMASPAAGGPVEVFGNAVAAGADTVAEGRNTANTRAGGFQGTRGDDSAAGGNIAQAPVALPFQVMGNAAGGAGTADGSASNNKTTKVGGPPNTDDDAGLVASNVVSTPVSGPVEGFGNAVGGAAWVVSNVDSKSDITAGGPATASGTGGIGSGNIVHGPFGVPVQLFGDVATALAEGESTTSNDTTSTAGGDMTSDGTSGFASGNVATGGLASATQGFGAAAAALGESDTASTNGTDTSSGGSVDTAGTGGFIGGNVVQVPTLALPQPHGDAVAGAGDSESAVVSDTELTSGGPVATDGTDGAISGNIASVPAGALAQAFAAAVSAVGAEADAEAHNTTDAIASGETTTAGGGFLSGIDGQVPVGAAVQPHDAPIEVLAEATTTASNDTTMLLGGSGPIVDLPLSGDGIPSLSGSADRSYDRAHDAIGPLDGASAFLDGLNGFGLPAVGSMPSAPSLPFVGGAMPSSGRFILPIPDGALPGVGSEVPGLNAANLPGTDRILPAGVLSGDALSGNALSGDALAGGLPVGGDALSGEALSGGSDVLPLPGSGLPGTDAVTLPSLDGVNAPVVGDGLSGVDGTLPGLDGGLPVVGGGLPGAGGLPVPDGGLPVVGGVPVVGDGMPVDGGLPGLDGVNVPVLDGGLPQLGGGLPIGHGVPVVGGDLPAVGSGLPGLEGVDLPAAPAAPGLDSLPSLESPAVSGVPAVSEVPATAPAPMPTPVDLPGELPAFDSLGGQEMLRRLTAELAGLVDAPASLPIGGFTG